jgi:hypothetical protein
VEKVMSAKDLIYAGAAAAAAAGMSEAQYVQEALEAFRLKSAKSDGDCQAEAGAARIRLKMREGRLGPSFTARTVYRSEWAGLRHPETVQRALELLVARRILSVEQRVKPFGQPTVWYHANPAVET